MYLTGNRATLGRMYVHEGVWDSRLLLHGVEDMYMYTCIIHTYVRTCLSVLGRLA